MTIKPLTFEVPSDLTFYVTFEEFVAIAAVNRDLRLERNVDGKLIVNPPTVGELGRRNIKIGRYLDEWTDNNGGVCFDSCCGFVLPNRATRSPDASWVSRDRWESLTQDEKDGFVPMSPDFVVELRSKTDSLSPLQDKMREYIENGTQLGWLIDPPNRRVEIYRSGRDIIIMNNPRQISDNETLPGFTLDLRKIWG